MPAYWAESRPTPAGRCCGSSSPTGAVNWRRSGRGTRKWRGSRPTPGCVASRFDSTTRNRPRRNKGRRPASRGTAGPERRELLDAGRRAQLLLQVLDALALELLANLRGDFGQRRGCRIAHIVEPDHMEAELRLDRRFGDLALVERDHRVAEFLDEGVG